MLRTGLDIYYQEEEPFAPSLSDLWWNYEDCHFWVWKAHPGSSDPSPGWYLCTRRDLKKHTIYMWDYTITPEEDDTWMLCDPRGDRINVFDNRLDATNQVQWLHQLDEEERERESEEAQEAERLRRQTTGRSAALRATALKREARRAGA